MVEAHEPLLFDKIWSWGSTDKDILCRRTNRNLSINDPGNIFLVIVTCMRKIRGVLIFGCVSLTKKFCKNQVALTVFPPQQRRMV